MTALVLAVAALLALMLASHGSRPRDLACLALVALSLLLATSLRGWGITRSDIQSKYLAFRVTNDAQRWQIQPRRKRLQRLPDLNILPDGPGPGNRAVRRRRLQAPVRWSSRWCRR